MTPLRLILAIIPLVVWNNVSAADLIRVSGKGEKKFAPDVSYLHLTVWGKGKTATAAQELNRKEYALAEQVLLKTFDIPAKDIKTEYYGLSPEYDYTPKNQRVLREYAANHKLNVTLHDLTAPGKIIDALLKIPANSIVGISIDGIFFGTEKRSALEVEVIALAMENAKTRAQAIAQTTGRPLKGIRAVTHGTGGTPIIAGRMENMAMDESAARLSAAPPTTVNPGQIEITADVTVDYEF